MQLTKKKTAIMALALILCIGTVSAVFLDYFGRIQTTITLNQSVLLDGKDYQTPISESLTVYGGYYYGDFHYLDNKANVPVDIMFEALPNTEGIEVQYLPFAHLTAIGKPLGKEARIVIIPEGLTLGDLETISWLVNTVSGYPPHIDITLDVDGDGIVDTEDMLTAELAVNNPAYAPPNYGTYNTWLSTFEMASGDGYGQINDNTIFWVTKLGAGDEDAPSSTLAHWKQGIVDNNPDTWTPDPDLSGIINANAPIVKLEIEVDNWIVDTEAYIGKVEVNGIPCTGLPVIAEGETFTLPANEILYFCAEYYIDPRLVPSGSYTVTTYVKPA